MAMLAKIDWNKQPTEPERVYSGFPWWHGLLVEPNREKWSADWLIGHTSVHPYLPSYTKVIKRRGPSSMRRLCPAVPGMIFAPIEMMQIMRRAEVFKYARIRGYLKDEQGAPAMIGKDDIERVRLMEAKLNLPPEAKGVLLKLKQRVRFISDLFDSWGQGLVVEIASESRIGVEVDHLFGRKTKIYVPASEIEAM